MRVKYALSKKVTIELDTDSPRMCFVQLAALDSVFRDEPCGMCGSDDTYMNHRRTEVGHDYLEKVCGKCDARLDIGQNKDMKRLYIKRKDDSRTNGWYKWEPV